MTTHNSELTSEQHMRKYFESGCLCILNGEIKKLADNVNDARAVRYYEAHCVCSRNYKHLEATE